MPVERAIARIYGVSSVIVGTGFLVDDIHVMTCAHVVNSALGRPRDVEDQPTDPVTLDFPLIVGEQTNPITARVEMWLPMNRGDIALLLLDGPKPEGVQSVKFASTAGDIWGKECRTFGFHIRSGKPATGRTLTRQADGWLTVEADPDSQYFVEEGFSGAPAWDAYARVLGMVVTRDMGARVAYIIPSERLRAFWRGKRAVTDILQKWRLPDTIFPKRITVFPVSVLAIVALVVLVFGLNLITGDSSERHITPSRLPDNGIIEYNVSERFAPVKASYMAGRNVHVPMVNKQIVVDGDVDDWEGIPRYRVNWGPSPSQDEDNNGFLEFALVADRDNLYVYAWTPDQTPVRGFNEREFWNEDSSEIYLNLGDRSAKRYGYGTFQIIITPTDAGKDNPYLLTITGYNSQDAEVRGFVFADEQIWGYEIAISLSHFDYIPIDEARIGFNIALNGATKEGEDRDVKLSWSNLDTYDRSYVDPSVFGTLVFEDVE